MKLQSDGSKHQQGSELIEILVFVNRVTTVMKGGRRFSFLALVVVGDGKGSVGFASGKAKEVPDAVRKATAKAKKKLVKISLRSGRTLHHDVIGSYGSARMVMRSAPPGTGIIAGGAARSLFEALGIQDIVVKSVGSSNPHNMIKAAFSGLRSTYSPRVLAASRGKRVTDIVVRRDATVDEVSNA